MGHPPRNQVKEDTEKITIDDMNQGVGYSTKKGFINVEVGQGSKLLRQMNGELYEAPVVGLVLA